MKYKYSHKILTVLYFDDKIIHASVLCTNRHIKYLGGEI